MEASFRSPAFWKVADMTVREENFLDSCSSCQKTWRPSTTVSTRFMNACMHTAGFLPAEMKLDIVSGQLDWRAMCADRQCHIWPAWRTGAAGQ